ncbi:hypothetical protein L7F22_065505 [Adiantum nelumboides]|nr:hypothetical protein [Adiantum nelumboides]
MCVRIEHKSIGKGEEVERSSSSSSFFSGSGILHDGEYRSSGSLKLVSSSVLVLLTDFCKLDWLVSGYWLETADYWFRTVSVSGYWLVLSLVTDSVIREETVVQVLDWLADLVLCFVLVSGFGLISVTGRGSGSVHWSGFVTGSEHKHIESASIYTGTYYPSTLGSGPSTGTQGSATQDPHITASDSSSDFDVMEGYPMQQHPESSSQDMHALGQQPGVSMFSRLKETLSRVTRLEHATNEINKGDGEVDSLFTSQIDPVLSESVHVSTPSTTPIGLSNFTHSETLLPDGRSLAEVQEVECYILAAKEKEIESLRKAKQRREILAKAPMTSVNPLQSPELTTLKSQPIGSHIASDSKDTPNASILDGVFLNENWEYNLQTEKLTDLYTSYTYHVGWLDVIQATSNSTSVDEQQRMICDVIHSIVQMERQNLGLICLQWVL